MPGLILEWDAYLRCKRSLSKENVMSIRMETRDDAQIIEYSSDLLTLLRDLPNLRVLSLVRSGKPQDPGLPLGTSLRHLGDSTGLKELPLSGFLVDPARLNVGPHGLLLRYYEKSYREGGFGMGSVGTTITTSLASSIAEKLIGKFLKATTR
jgi:hypothetical protein